MGTKIAAVVLLLGAIGMAIPTMLYGMRFSVLFNRGRQQHDLTDEEKHIVYDGPASQVDQDVLNAIYQGKQEALA